MVTSLVPSGKVPSTWTSSSISGTPSITSSRLRMVRPKAISSETLRPSRIPSSTSAAMKMRSLSCSRGVRCMAGDSTSNGQMLSHRIVTQVGGGSARHDGALAHDGVGVGEAPCEFEILLDEEHGDAALLDALDRSFDLLDHVRLYPFRGLVHQEQLGPREEHAGDGQLLLLAAREHAPFAREELSELGKQVEDLLDVSLGGAAVARRLRPSEKTHPQILGDGQVGEDLPPLRHVPD